MLARRAAALLLLLLPAACDETTAPGEHGPAIHDLVFTARSRGFDELHRVPLAGGPAARLFAGSAELNASFPAPSPDGRRIAYYDERDDELWVADLATGARVNVSGNDFELDYMPTWSPDGARLAFASSRTGDHDVYVVNADGTGLRQLTADPSPATHRDYAPAWSPDGSRIAFTSDRDGTMQLWTMRPDGSDPRQVTAGATTRAYEPSWSPDGTRLVFRRVSNVGGAAATQLAIVNRDGSGLVELPLSGTENWPSWSPDGTRIAFSSNLALTDTRLYTIAPDGTQLTEIAGGPGLGYHATHPRWLRRR